MLQYHHMKLSELSAREYHAQREANQLRQREQMRRELLTRAKTAINQLAPNFPAIKAIYLFGSILQTGRFTNRSDIDVAVASDDLAAESAFWRALEEMLNWPVDVRPYQPPITQAVADFGECVYARKSHRP